MHQSYIHKHRYGWLHNLFSQVWSWGRVLEREEEPCPEGCCQVPAEHLCLPTWECSGLSTGPKQWLDSTKIWSILYAKVSLTFLRMKLQFEASRARTSWIRTCPCTRRRCASLVLSKEQSSLFKFLPFVPHHLRQRCLDTRTIVREPGEFATILNIASGHVSGVWMSWHVWYYVQELLHQSWTTRSIYDQCFPWNA